MRVAVWDLEVANNPECVQGGWGNKAGLGISSGVVWISWQGGAGGRYRIFRGERMAAMIDLLGQADLLIGFNSLAFDCPLLEACGYELPPRDHCDLIALCSEVLGFWPSLQRLAWATLGEGKNGHGQHAPILAQEGRWDELYDYNLRDVELTRRLFEFAMDVGYLLIDEDTGPRRIPIEVPGGVAWKPAIANGHDLSPATPKQIEYIRKLYGFKWEPTPGFTKAQASDLIQQLVGS